MTLPAVFQSTIQKSMDWITALKGREGMPDEHRAHAALRAVLHQLRDRLPVDEAAHFGAQLPLLIRGIYYEGFKPSKMPQKVDAIGFFAGVDEKLKDHPELNAQVVVPEVFRVIDEHVTHGEVDDVIQMLPRELQTLWPRVAA